MLPRARRWLDVRPGEALPVLLTFLYIAIVVACFLLAKAVRTGLFLHHYGPFALAYVYAAVPIVLSVFVPVYTRVAARFGHRVVTFGTLLFFAANVVIFWIAFRYFPVRPLAAIFYVWVNCFGIIAPVQAWSFANSIFDTRQARRLFGIVGSGASLGAIVGGLLARLLAQRVGGAVNLLLVLAGMIVLASVVVIVANAKVRRRGLARRGKPTAPPFRQTLASIARTPYLRLIAAMVLLVAIATQWTGFQLNLVANERFGADPEALTQFFGTFNFSLGIVSFFVQLALTGRALRRFGLGLTLLLLPLALGGGTALVLLIPLFWPVLLTNAFDQGLRFSVDKASYELLYLPMAPGVRAHVKNTIDIVINRFGDATGGILLGLVTRGFFGIPGLHVGLRGTAAINLVLIAVWVFVAVRLRREYVGTIRDSIHRHRLDLERGTSASRERSAADAIAAHLSSSDPADVVYGLSLLEGGTADRWRTQVRGLLRHESADVRRRAFLVLAAEHDDELATAAEALLRDPDAGVRTEALLYLVRHRGVDPVTQIEQLGDFADFSIRAGIAAFLASPGPARNLDAARAIVEQMVRSAGPAGVRDRIEAARVLAVVPDGLDDLLERLIADENVSVARQAIAAAAGRGGAMGSMTAALLASLHRRDLVDAAADALAGAGDAAVPALRDVLQNDDLPVEMRREIPGVLLRIGTPAAAEALVDSLLQGDASVRYRIIASLNTLRRRGGLAVDPALLELLLAAEISGHYRSYQAVGALPARVRQTDVLGGVRQSMEQELERIFRLLSLMLPDVDLQDAYVGLRSANEAIRANALEFLDNVLAPSLRQLLLPLIDPHVTLDERIAIANRIVGAPLTSAEQAVDTLLASGDLWLKSSAAQAVGVLRLRGLAPRVRRLAVSAEPAVQDAAVAALRRLDEEESEEAAADPAASAPAHMDLGV